MLRELKEIYQSSIDELSGQWSRKTWRYWYAVYELFFDKREEKLINFALKRWKIDGLKKKSKKSNN